MNGLEKGTAGQEVIIIGGGPAGLTAAYELTKHDYRPIVFEQRDKVGGISRTEHYKGFYFDMGGHRFYTKVPEVTQIWHAVLAGDFLRRPRMSRIFYGGKFFYYPLRPFNALLNLGPVEGAIIVASYLRWAIFPYKQEDTFEQWVTNRFGKRLFETFFKTYTEKVWGIPCSELKAEWAAQRIKSLSLKSVLLSMFLKPKDTIVTLIEEFDYPRRGPGMMWEAVKNEVEQGGGIVWMNSEVIRTCRQGNRLESIEVSQNGRRRMIEGDQFISSMPITTFVKNLDPPAPQAVQEAADTRRYRDFLTVCLIVDEPELFPDNWIYIHDPEVQVGRIQNYKNWSPDMVPDLSKTSLGLEYFCNEGDELWLTADEDLIELGRREIAYLDLCDYESFLDGCVFRVDKTYPVYDGDYRQALDTLRSFVEKLENFQTIGRNGLHRYNNQDHAMLSGLYAVRNVTMGEQNDLWAINTELEYLEEFDSEAERDEGFAVLEEALSHAFLRVDPLAFGVATGLVSGLILFLATLILVLKGGEVVGPRLGLLGEFFPGYAVTAPGSLIGLVYGIVFGFVCGWAIAYIRNVIIFLYVAGIQYRAERRVLRRMFDYI